MLKRSSNALKPWVVVTVGALVLALCAFFTLPGFSPDPTFAQTPGPIEYAENSDVDEMPVRTFTSKDPEGAGINWDVTGIDADDFTISGGVLKFKKSPNYENPSDRMHGDLDRNRDGDTADTDDGIDVAAASAADNMYQVTIRASEMRESGRMDRALSTETHVTVEVTDVNEDGMVTIDLRQPEVGSPIMASVTDPDGTNGVTWQWSVSTVTSPVPTANNHWANATGNNPQSATYTPAGKRNSAQTPIPSANTGNVSIDEGKYLRAVVTYTDSFGVSREAIGVSQFPVRAEVSTKIDRDTNPENGSPGFRQGADYTRTVSESLGKGMNVEDPVVATDPNSTEPNDRGPNDPNHDPSSDKLTYELDNDDNRSTPLVTTFDHDNDGNTPNIPTDVTFFSIDKTSGQLMVEKTLDWDENPNETNPDGKYEFYVLATDPSGETAKVKVTVIATDANDVPTIKGSTAADNQAAPAAPSEIRVLEQDSDDRNPPAGPDATYYGTPDGMMGTDGLPVALALGNQNVFTAPDEDERGQITWTLDGIDQDDFVLSQTNLSGSDEPVAIVFKDAPDYENPTDADGDSVYKVTLVASDGDLMDTRPLTVFVDNVAEQGKATLMATGNGIDQPTIGSTITADVVDPDDGVAVLTWQWQKSMAGDFVDDEDNKVIIIDSATAPDYTPAGGDDGYYLRAIATYIDTTSEMDDPDTGAIDERVQKSDTAAYTPSMGDGTLDTDNDKVFRLSVTSEYAVRVRPGGTPEQTAPEFTMESYELKLFENAEVGSIVGTPLYGEVMGDGVFTFDLDATETDDDNYFTIDKNTGQIRVREIDFRLGRAGTIYPMKDDDLNMGETGYPYGDNAPSMEDPVLDFEGTNVFRLVVTATDSTNSRRKATTDVIIRLDDLNEWPYFDKASRGAVAEPIPYAESRVNKVVTLAATEPDGGSLRWEVEGTDAADFEMRDAEDFPVGGDDRWELHFKSQPNYEKPTARGKADGASRDERNRYSLIVRAIEETAVGGGPNLAAELTVTVQVTNSNEPGKVEVKWLQPEVGTPLPATLMDPDGNPGAMLPIVMANGDTMIADGVTWQWYRAKNSNPDLDPEIDTLGGPTSDWEAIPPVAGPPSNPDATGAYTPQAADGTWMLLVKADYTDGQGATKSAIGTTYMPVRADVPDEDNNSPDFSQDTTTRSVPEDTAVGANVGPPVEVDVKEDNDTLTYTLDNDKDPGTPFDKPAGADTVGDAAMNNPGDVSYFSIHKKTGQIMVAKPLDWERNPSGPSEADGKYVVWVRATDPSGEMTNNEDNDYIKVTITATDVNEAPTVTGGLAEISIYEDSHKFVGLGYMQGGTMDRADPNLYRRLDHDRVDSGKWSIGGLDGSYFEYSTPVDEPDIGRRLHFKKANLPDYENPMDDNRDNVYEVTVIVQDNAGLTGMKKVRITVMNVDEAGKLVLSPEQPDTGTPVKATLTDPDGVEIITDWEWAETDSRVTEFPGNVKVYSTTDVHQGNLGSFVWARVHYRDGASVDDDPVTALDERNNDPGTDVVTEHHKFPVDGTDDMLDHNSDIMMSKGTDNAVREDPTGGTDPAMPSLGVVMIDRMVYENVPSTGYVGMSLNDSQNDLRYPDGEDGYAVRDTIGGPDVAFFVFAEDKDDTVRDGYYDSMLVDGSKYDKFGQLAAAAVTHFDADGDKTEYIIEVTDPDAEVSVGPVRVTITVMNVNEAPSAPGELKGGIAISGLSAVDYSEVTDAEAATWDAVGMYRAQGGESASAVWTLNGADAGAFTITANGANGMADTTGANAVLTLDAAPNYEMPMDADMDNVYEVTLTASDGTNRASRDLTVTVGNMEEDGRVTFWRDGQDATAAAIMVGDELTGLAEDPDGNPGDMLPLSGMYTQITGTVMWQWSRHDAPSDGSDPADDSSDWADISGATNAAYTVDAADDDKFLRATAMYDDMEGDGKTAMGMTMGVGSTPTTGSEIGDRYDDVANGGNGDGEISSTEMLKAVRDYFAQGSTITVSQMLELVRIYFGS